MDPDTIAAVVKRGDPEDVEELIAAIEELSISEQLQTFDAGYETLLSCMDLEGAESRRAVVRVVSTLSPAMSRLVADTTVPNYATPGEDTFATAIDREAALYVGALGDDSEAVREAAVAAIEDFCVACQMDGDGERLQALYDDLEAVAEDVTPEKREAVEQAKDHAFSKLH